MEEVESLGSARTCWGRAHCVVAAAVMVTALTGCASFMPTVGPSAHKIVNSREPVGLAGIQVIDVDNAVTQKLVGLRVQKKFSETLGTESSVTRKVGPGDVLEVSIWEAAPATLFGVTPTTDIPGVISSASAIAPSHSTTLPEQMVDDNGSIVVPFIGRIQAQGKTLDAIESEIMKGLSKKANQPQVIVRMTHNFSANATIVGEVTNSTRVPLIPGNERLLDAIAAAGGVRQPVNKTTIQITRAENVYSLPLETIIEDPRQNVALLPGDVITALFQPYSFMALGATGKNDEINFETQGITLAQAMARAGALIDQRSNAQGVFIFRLVGQSDFASLRQPTTPVVAGKVPVVFRIDLSKPSSFFVMQSFPIEDRDVLYVSNAPVTELQKFLNLLFTVAYPVLTAKQVGF